MYEFHSEDFAEFYKLDFSYQHVQDNNIYKGNNAIESYTTQQYTTPLNNYEEPDLFKLNNNEISSRIHPSLHLVM